MAYGHHLLSNHFRSPRNLKEWCQQIGISREHFSRAFKERYGVSPAAFLRQLRLTHANQLLQSHHLSIHDVAAASGFASPQTFHRAFTQFYGSPPGGKRIGKTNTR